MKEDWTEVVNNSIRKGLYTEDGIDKAMKGHSKSKR